MRIGVIGLGYWGPNLVRNFLGTEGVVGVVCCDFLEKRLQKIKQKYPSVELASSVEQLLERKDVDAVVVATPIATHKKLGSMVLQAGKHLLVEKPMAASSADARELMQQAEKRNLVLMVDHTFLYTAAVRKIREIMDMGKLGDILYFDSVRVNLGIFQHDTNVLWDLAPHDVSILCHLIDREPVSVSTVGANHYNGVADMAYLTVQFSDNLIAHFHVNWLSPVKIRRILIGGTKHMVVYDDVEPTEKLKVYDKGVDITEEESVYQTLVQYRIGDMFAPQIDQTEALSLLASEFVQCIQHGKKPISDGILGLKVVKILEAADASLRSGGKNIILSQFNSD
jgi:predicted dehydrogenase